MQKSKEYPNLEFEAFQGYALHNVQIEAPSTRQNIFGAAQMKKVRIPQKLVRHTDRFCRVNDFATIEPDQISPVLVPCREVVRARIKLVSDLENLDKVIRCSE